MPENRRFNSYDAVVIEGSDFTGIYYGGDSRPAGTGYGYAVAERGMYGFNITYWKQSEAEGGEIIVNSWASSIPLRDYLAV